MGISNNSGNGPVRARRGAAAGLAGGLALAAVLAPAAAQAASGDLDPSFGPVGGIIKGQVTKAFGKEKDAVYGLALQPDGKIVAAGTSAGKVAVARLLPSGKPDEKFGKPDAEGKGGQVLTAVGRNAEARAAAVQKDGKIVVAGFYEEPGLGASSGDRAKPGLRLMVNRYTPEGKADRAFGYGGSVISGIGGKEAAGYGVAVQPDGKIVAVGTSEDRVALARFTADGKPDTAFGQQGTVATRFGTKSQGSAVAVQPDGGILVAGTCADGKGSDFLLARYTAAGVPDAAFGKGGGVSVDFGTKADTGHAIAVQKDGKAVVGGTADGRVAVARVGTDGKPDAGFGNAGRMVTETGDSAAGRGVAVQPDGKIVVAGFRNEADSGDSQVAVRYDAAGKPDTGFGEDGVAVSDFGTPSDRGHAVVVQRDGNIVVGGRSRHPVLGDSFALTRFLGK